MKWFFLLFLFIGCHGNLIRFHGSSSSSLVLFDVKPPEAVAVVVGEGQLSVDNNDLRIDSNGVLYVDRMQDRMQTRIFNGLHSMQLSLDFINTTLVLKEDLPLNSVLLSLPKETLVDHELVSLDNNGLLRLSRQLDREVQDVFRIPFSFNSITRLLTIRVTDVNEHPPEVVCGDVFVKEDTAVDTEVAVVSVFDPDFEAPSVVDKQSVIPDYSLTFDLKDRFFEVKEGRVILKETLDFEAQTLHFLDISVSDGLFRTHCQLRVHVVDVNDNKPEFERQEYHALVDQPGVVLTVRAVDKDVNDTVKYELMDEVPVQLNSTSGEVAVFAKQSLVFQVTARDLANHSSQTTVFLTVLDNFKPRTRLKTYPTTLLVDNKRAAFKEGSPVGALEFVSTAVNLSMTIQGQDCLDFLSFDLKTGVISVKKALESSFIQCFLLFDDSFSLLQVLFQDLAPELRAKRASDALSVTVELTEDTTVGQAVLDLVSQSKMPALKARDFKICFQDNDNFAVQDGLVVLQRPLDRERQENLTLVVVALDRRDPFEQPVFLSILFWVQDVQDSPLFFSQDVYFASVSESAVRGQAVLRVHAFDADKTPPIQFEILSGNSDHAFSMTANQIRTNSVLDREITPLYDLVVMATSLNETRIARVVVEVTDEDDNLPVVLNRALSVRKRGFVGSVQANDVDDEVLEFESESKEFFVERLSGRVFFTGRRHGNLRLKVRDRAHAVSTELTVKFQERMRSQLIEKECLDKCLVMETDVDLKSKDFFTENRRLVFNGSRSSWVSFDSNNTRFLVIVHVIQDKCRPLSDLCVIDLPFTARSASSPWISLQNQLISLVPKNRLPRLSRVNLDDQQVSVINDFEEQVLPSSSSWFMSSLSLCLLTLFLVFGLIMFSRKKSSLYYAASVSSRGSQMTQIEEEDQEVANIMESTADNYFNRLGVHFHEVPPSVDDDLEVQSEHQLSFRGKRKASEFTREWLAGEVRATYARPRSPEVTPLTRVLDEIQEKLEEHFYDHLY